MSILRSLSAIIMLLLVVSESAVANQYASYPQYRYAPPPPQYAYNPYSRASAPYYYGYRYPSAPSAQAGQMYRRQVESPLTQRAPVNNTGKSQTSTTAKTGKSSKRVTLDKPVLSEKKQGFIQALLPHIEKENQRLTLLRKNVIQLLSRHEIDALDNNEKQRLLRLAKKYRVAGDPLSDKSAGVELLAKIDIIPSSLALAQATNESAWGKSRFAKEANNLFGIWTYDETKGLVPKKREEGKKHLVRIFDDYADSVQYYMYTLNSNPAYKDLRQIRQQLRKNNQPINGHVLAAGLTKYSAKGQEYIDLIRSLIRQNKWANLDIDKQMTTHDRGRTNATS